MHNPARLRTLALSLAFAGALGLAGCSSGDDAPLVSADAGTPVAAEPKFEPIELTVAHVNDHHSQLEPFAATELVLDGEPTRVELGGFARLTAAFSGLAAKKNLLKLHAGDAITGTLYYTFYKGEADARMMNGVCFDAFTLGNHEFDDGDAALRDFLDTLRQGGCQTPVLAANVRPQVGTPLAPTAAADYVKPYVLKTFDGVKVAVIGIDVSGKTQNSSRPLATTVFEDEVVSAQAQIDALKADGVRHFVVLSHQGYENDRAMAAALTDVDVIVGGDSHTLLGDFSAHGLSTSGAYPTMATNRDGHPVCIGQAWEYAKAIGRMNVSFDADGRIASCDGQVSLLIGGSFSRKDAAGAWVAMPGPDRQALVDRLAGVPTVKVLEPDASAASLLQSYTDQVAAEKAKVIGSASEALCLVRVPGESTNRSTGVAGCETANTLARGSDAAQAVAQAFLAASLRADIALQNAGGVRIALPAGDITMNTAFTLLPFTNVLVELDISGAEIVAALEDAVSNHIDAGQSSGSHPYAAGLRWSLDMSQPTGSRFSAVEAKDRATGQWSALDPARRYVVVTNDFIAEGRDGYTTLGTVFAEGRSVNTYLLYTQSFADWVVANGTIGRPAPGDYSHQAVVTAAGVALP